MKSKYFDIKNKLDKSGYCLLTNVMSENEFVLCKKIADELETLPEIKGGPMKYFEESNQNQEILNRVEDFCYMDNKFKNFMCTKLIQLIMEITSNSYVLFKEKINFKMPGSGGFNIHQDFPAFNRFIKSEMLILMIPLQETNESNGCLQVASNYFTKELIPHENGTVPVDKLNHIIWENINMNQKDILIFSSFLLHKSEPNKSSQSRRSFFLTYNLASAGDVRDDYILYKRTSFPPRIDRDVNTNLEEWRTKLARKIL